MAKSSKKNAASWYHKGKDGVQVSKRVDEEARIRREQQGPMRFWLEKDSSAKVTLLDSPEFFMYEHNLEIAGKFFNHFTCIKEFDTCPLCESGDRPSFVVVATVINHKKYTDKEGKTRINQKQLLVAKGKARQVLLRQIERRDGDLKYCAYELTRGTVATECSSGEDQEFLGRLTKQKLEGLIPEGEDASWLEPFDYEKIFAPKSQEELRKIVNMPAPVGSADEGSGKAEDGLNLGDDEKEGKTPGKAVDEGLSIEDLI